MSFGVKVENVRGNSYDLILKNGDKYNISMKGNNVSTDALYRDFELTFKGPAIEGELPLRGSVCKDFIKFGDSDYYSFTLVPSLSSIGITEDDQILLREFFKVMVFDPLSKVSFDSRMTVFQAWMSAKDSLENLAMTALYDKEKTPDFSHIIHTIKNYQPKIVGANENSYDLVFSNGDKYNVSMVKKFVYDTVTLNRFFFNITGEIDELIPLHCSVNAYDVCKGSWNDYTVKMNPAFKASSDDDKALLGKIFKGMIFDPLSKISLDSSMTVFQAWMSEFGSLESLLKDASTHKKERTAMLKILKENSHFR